MAAGCFHPIVVKTMVQKFSDALKALWLVIEQSIFHGFFPLAGESKATAAISFHQQFDPIQPLPNPASPGALLWSRKFALYSLRSLWRQ